MNVIYLLNNRYILSLPLILLFFLASIDFIFLLGLGEREDVVFAASYQAFSGEIDPRRIDAAILKARFQSAVYMLTIGLSVFYAKQIFRYFLTHPHLLLIFIYLLSGTIYSISPSKVLSNTVILVISFIAGILFCEHRNAKANYHDLYLIFLIPLVVIHTAGLWFLANLQIDIVDYIVSDLRFGGLVGNPNTYGITCTIGFWASLSLLAAKECHIFTRLFALYCIALFVVGALLTGSTTTIVNLVVITVTLIWMMGIIRFKTGSRVLAIFITALLAVIISVFVLILFTPAELLSLSTESVGKDTTPAGRTDLWQIALDAITNRPAFGWGFDSHISVKSDVDCDMPYNHYHNGFLDTMVAGGILLIVIVIYNFARFVRYFSRVIAINPAAYPLVIPLVVLVVLNITEYALLRPNSHLWLVYTAVFVTLSHPFTIIGKKRKTSSPKRRSRTRSRSRSKSKRNKTGSSKTSLHRIRSKNRSA